MFLTNDIKNKFANSVKGSVVPENIFGLITKIEKDSGVEIYNMTYEEIIYGILRHSRMNKVDSVRSALYNILKYIEWLQLEMGVIIDPEVIGENLAIRFGNNPNKMESEISEIRRIITKYVTHKTTVYQTPEELFSVLDYIFGLSSTEDIKADGVQIEEIAAAYLMLLFQGFTKDEIINDLKLSMASFDNNQLVIQNDNHEEVIYKPFVKLLKRIIEKRVFLRNRGSYDYNYKLYMLDSDFLIATYHQREQLTKVFSNISNRRIRELSAGERQKINISASNVYIMGLVYKLKSNNVDINKFVSQQRYKLSRSVLDEIVRYYHI